LGHGTKLIIEYGAICKTGKIFFGGISGKISKKLNE